MCVCNEEKWKWKWKWSFSWMMKLWLIIWSLWKWKIIPTLIFHLFYHKTWSLFLLYQNCDTQNWCNGSIIVAPITPCLILSFSYYNNEMKSDIFHICTPKFTIQRCGKKKIMVVSVAVKMTKKTISTWKIRIQIKKKLTKITNVSTKVSNNSRALIINAWNHIRKCFTVALATATTTPDADAVVAVIDIDVNAERCFGFSIAFSFITCIIFNMIFY